MTFDNQSHLTLSDFGSVITALNHHTKKNISKTVAERIRPGEEAEATLGK